MLFWDCICSGINVWEVCCMSPDALTNQHVTACSVRWRMMSSVSDTNARSAAPTRWPFCFKSHLTFWHFREWVCVFWHHREILLFASKTMNILIYDATSALELVCFALQLLYVMSESSSSGHPHHQPQQQIWGQWSDLRTMADLLHQTLMEEWQIQPHMGGW